jgi:hypothetical protein
VPVQSALEVDGADTIGGSATGDGNLIAGGGSASSGSVLQGNTFTDGGLNGPGAPRDATVAGFDVDGAVTVGGATATPGTGAGNTFYTVSPDLQELGVGGTGAVIQGNVFRGDPEGAIADGGDTVTIGGTTAQDGNLIEGNGSAGVSGLVDKKYWDGSSSKSGLVLLGGNALVENNTFVKNLGGGAVDIQFGTTGVTVTNNVMHGNNYGISFGDHYYDNGAYPSGSGIGAANDFQPYPIIRSADSRSAGIKITGIYTEPGLLHAPHSVTVELYATTSCGTGPYISQQGEAFLGSRRLSVSAITGFNLTFGPLPAGGYHAVTATATAPDGSTSEFSPCFTIGSAPLRFFKTGVTPASKAVAIMTVPAATGVATAAAAKAGKRKLGHGTLLLSCPVSAVNYGQGTFGVTVGKRVVARGRFKILPGYVHQVRLTFSGALLSKLERKHHLSAALTTIARDAAKRENRKTRTSDVKLVYKGT